MDSRNQIPWLRFLIEGIRIIVSILLAFLIDTGWELRGKRSEEREILKSLENDLTDLRNRLDYWSTFNRTGERLASVLLEKEIENLDRSIADSLFSSMLFVNVLDKGGGSLEALFASGRLELIRDKIIREALAKWPNRLEDIHTNDLSIRELVWHELIPLLAKMGIPEKRCEHLYCAESGPMPDKYMKALKNEEFRALLIWRIAAFTVSADDHESARDEADDLLELIGNRLSS